MSAPQYTITKWIGGGAFGSASICHPKNDPNQKYVIKKIRLDGLNIKETQAAIQEARLLRKLSSPFIVEYIDSFVIDSGIAIVIEYCDGGDLATEIAARKASNTPYSENKVETILYHLSSALDHCHSHNVLHRDVKTENIFICSQSHCVKLGDFGVSRQLDVESSMAQTQIGTPYYLSPEICKGEPYNNKSDIWSLGCVMYELMNMHRPFGEPHTGSLIMSIVNAKFKPLTEKYSVSLRALVQSMLIPHPKLRPATKQILEHECFSVSVPNRTPLDIKLRSLENQVLGKLDIMVGKHEAELLRMQLNKHLGPDKFGKIYEKCQKQSIVTDDYIKSILPKSNLHLQNKIKRLLQLEICDI